MNTDIDGLVVLIGLPPRADLGAATARLYRAFDEVGVRIDAWPHQCQVATSLQCPACIPRPVALALDAARAREREGRLLDRVWPRLFHKAWWPVAGWLCGIGRALGGARGPWREVARSLPGGVAARSSGGVAFLFAVCEEAKVGPFVALVFDWRTFNRCATGTDEISRLTATLGFRLQSVGAAGGPAEIWRGGVHRCVKQPADRGAMLAGSRGAVRGFGEHLVEVGGFVVGWRTPKARVVEQHELAAGVASIDEESIFSPRWAGCSGRFAPRQDGLDDAQLHYEKHVRVQREWPTEAMPSLETYVAFAARALDQVENSFEFWQPSNHAVVKYDAAEDVVAVGNLHDGDLRTCFRPGGVDYVLRKLRAGYWVPPPVRGAVAYDGVHDDEELTALFAEYERAVAEADAEAHAAAAAQDAHRILSAIAAHERAEYLGWRVRSQYLTASDETRIDAIELAFAEAHAALEVALEVCPPHAPTDAVTRSVDRYVRTLPDVLANGDAEEIEELLGLRDRIEWARMATRARGRLAGLVSAEAFREVELLSTDALVAVWRRGTVDTAPAGGWPDTFIWRCGEQT